MGVYDLFSKRQKRLRGEVSDTYQYDAVPDKLRVQFYHICKDALTDDGRFEGEAISSAIKNVICREYGLRDMPNQFDQNETTVLFDFLYSSKDTEQVLDIIELYARFIDLGIREEKWNSRLSPDGAIIELNDRFKENRFGYQYESGQIIRLDSQFIHSELVKPALQILTDKIYKGANEEFLSAHGHYRKGRYKECIVDCLKSFESTMKSICDKRGWSYDPKKDTASKLIEILFKKKLVPDYMQSHFTSLRSTLESGVPAVRNKTSGHGQGAIPKPVPDYIAAYALHLTATTILFLAKADEALK